MAEMIYPLSECPVFLMELIQKLSLGKLHSRKKVINVLIVFVCAIE